MSDLNHALQEIKHIRRQVATSTEFRGYGPLTLCGTAALAISTGILQRTLLKHPETHPLQYILLWSSTAILSLGLIAAQTLTRAKRIHSSLADEMIHMAVEHFLPALAAGTLLTILLFRVDTRLLWLFPGLWQIIYSLGIFSSCRFLPRNLLAAAAWYLLSGLLCVSLGDIRALSPVVMAGAYGVGQCMIGAMLYVASKGAPSEQ